MRACAGERRKLGTQLILLAYVAYTGWDFYGWASWKYRDWSSQRGGSGMYDWHSCDWGGQCPGFYTSPECAADPAHATKECIDSARHIQYSYAKDEELCETTCPGAGNTNCGVWKKVMFDDVQQETRVEWEFGMNLQHFARWLTMGVAAFTLKDLQADEHGKLQPLVRAIIILVAAEIVIELIHVISTYQSCNDPGSNQPRPCDVGHFGDPSTPAAVRLPMRRRASFMRADAFALRSMCAMPSPPQTRLCSAKRRVTCTTSSISSARYSSTSTSSGSSVRLSCLRRLARCPAQSSAFLASSFSADPFAFCPTASFEKSVRGAAPATPAASPAEPV